MAVDDPYKAPAPENGDSDSNVTGFRWRIVPTLIFGSLGLICLVVGIGMVIKVIVFDNIDWRMLVSTEVSAGQKRQLLFHAGLP